MRVWLMLLVVGCKSSPAPEQAHAGSSAATPAVLDARDEGRIVPAKKLEPALVRRIEQLIHSDTAVLFMKGTRSAPLDGFSAQVVEILETLHASYTTVDVLADSELRDAMPIYSDWPTFPQLYIKNQFIGGAQMVRDMQKTGELARELGVPSVPAVGDRPMH